ncbi:AMP-binding protein [Acuticoccus kandeliae]|uniref:AMP-binding protein n=1 Tax=Acuticoccus kandeliae TaxID=2073160 RepID=UPI000D3EA71A|nr:AMP-binding protein [Acuticoccus kandeliae]
MPNVFDALAGAVEDRQRPFILRDDAPDITYAAMHEITARQGGTLRAAGVGVGDVVALLVEKSAEALMLYLAISRIGAVALPVHVGLSRAEIDLILSDAAPSLIVCDPAFAEAVGGIAPVLTLDAKAEGTFRAAFDGAEPVRDSVDLPADAWNAIVYTSGTTGRPKGAIIGVEQVVWNVTAISTTWKIGPGDVLLHLNLMAYGIFATMLPVLAAGGAIRLVADSAIDTILANLPRVTMMASVPTVYHRLLREARFDRAACRSMRLFITGSAPMREDLFNAFRERTGHELLDRYGMTEALLISSNRVDEARAPGNSGYALPDSQIRIRDGEGRTLPATAVGGIEVRQPAPFIGYLNHPEKTAEAFTEDGWLITGDFGHLDERGRLTVLGRGFELIITGGLNVYPKEVELAINAMPGVLESAVIGVPHADYGEAVVAVIELDGHGAGFSAEAARNLLRASLAGYKVPKHWEIVERLPRNALGKVKKRELQEMLQAHFA